MSRPPLQAGERIPSYDLMEDTPDNTVNLGNVMKGHKVIIFGVPGAFTPGCSMHHLPGYVQSYQKFKDKGIEEIICITVNDPFVCSAWCKASEATGKVRILSDANCAFTRAIGMDLDLSKNLGNMRSRRYAMLVDDGIAKYVAVEPDGTGVDCSLAPRLLENM